jgi:general secretion pathway protein F
MAAFEYNALDARGRTERGMLRGETARQVRQQLRERGLVPLEVTAVEERAAGGAAGSRRLRLGGAELALVLRQLASLVAAGLQVETALGTVARQASRAASRRVLLGVHGRVLEGESLAGAMQAYPGAFPRAICAAVGAGEGSGRLADVLVRLADDAEHSRALRRALGLALIYPLVLASVALLVVAGLIGYAVPQVVRVFDSLGQDLPWLTRALIDVSDLVRGSWPLGVAALIGAVLALRLVMRRPRGRHALHRAILSIPVLSRFVVAANTARFTRTLGLLVGSAVPLLEALNVARASIGSEPMRDAVDAATRAVGEGSPLHAALEVSGLFPPVTVQLIANGEASGRLGEMLDRGAASLESELETAAAVALAVLEPALIVTVGAVVLAIVVAILLPVFELNQLVR